MLFIFVVFLDSIHHYDSVKKGGIEAFYNRFINILESLMLTNDCQLARRKRGDITKSHYDTICTAWKWDEVT